MKAADLKKILDQVPDSADVWIEYPYPQRVKKEEDIGNDGDRIIDAWSAGYSEIKHRVVIWHNY